MSKPSAVFRAEPDPEWRTRWARLLTTPEQAVRALRPGRRILIGSAAAEPTRLVQAMVDAAWQLSDNELVHLMTLGPAPYTTAACEGRFRANTFFIGPNVRDAVREGRADFSPVFLSEIPHLLKSNRLPVDAALIQVSPPDAHGMVSLGVSVDIVRAAVDSARIILAEVNPRMPRTPGDTLLDIRRCKHVVEVDAPLPEREPMLSNEVSRAIGELVADLVPDAATLQIGIGDLPAAVLPALRNHRDLGIHTEMLSDEVMELARLGVINGLRKTLAPGKMVASFLLGSEALYRWAHQNPDLEMRASDWVNDPYVISQNVRMVSINTALAVDLTGQVAADTLDSGFYSGIGGQVDFVRGSSRSSGGRALIVLPSLARGGTVSRIRATLPDGSAVVTSRGDVRFVVTEYGVADLWGKSVRERALALTAIAHPDHRADLLAAAKERRWVFADQAVPRPPLDVRSWDEKLRDGREIRVRAARLTDEARVQQLLYGLSPESVYSRFHHLRTRYPHDEIQALLDADPQRGCAFVAELPEDGTLIGLTRYDLDPVSGIGELGIVIADAWQRKGVGSALMRRMVEVGRANGLKGLRADVLAVNSAMIALLRDVGADEVPPPEGGVVDVEFRFKESQPTPQAVPVPAPEVPELNRPARPHPAR
ncbi:MAG TPA: GNAT family N-acetyltransferase [Myxococcaceae bacterium]|nr:GNAT family N-acetyltransferase [Myxococcaceae bacterium]